MKNVVFIALLCLYHFSVAPSPAALYYCLYCLPVSEEAPPAVPTPPWIYGAPYTTLDTTPSPFVRPSLNNIVVPGLMYSGLYIKRNLICPLSPVRSKSVFISSTLAA